MTSYTVYFKDWETCPFVSSCCLPSWFLSPLLLLFVSLSLTSFSQRWGTQVVLGLGLGLSVSQGLHWQASVWPDATEAGLAGASGMRLNFHTNLNIGSFPIVTTDKGYKHKA